MTRWTFALALAAALAGPCGGAAAQDDPAPAVRQVVLDIMSFTRWPEPRAELRLCVVGQPVYADAFFRGEMQVGGVGVRPQRLGAGDERLGMACDAVYQGPLTPPERESLGRNIAGHPVLTMGETVPGCIEATMFCLQVRGATVTFASNLDAIARSGVKLNPRVLLLGRRPQGPR